MSSSRFPIPQGTLDMLILQILSLEPAHGYGIAQRLEQISKSVVQVNQGSLYPALHRLEQKGWLKADWKQSKAGGRPRSRIAVPHRPPRDGPNSFWFARARGEKARRAGTRGRYAGSGGGARHLADSMAARFRVRPALFGTIFSPEPVVYGDGSAFPRARNWSDDRPLLSYRSGRSARAPGRPLRTPGSHRLDRLPNGRDL